MTLVDTPDLCVTMRLRTRDDLSEFSAGERQTRLERVLPHLQRAARMQQRNQELNELAALGMAGLDTLDFGVMVIERGMRVKYANAWVRAMTEEDDRLSLDGGHFHSADLSHDAALRNLIEHAAGSMGVQGAAGSWMYLARDGRPVPFIATPLAPSDALRSAWASPLALVLVGNSETRSVMDAGVLASLFGLTNKECIVAARLAAGETLQEIADREFLSLHTVRVHIRDILRKTGTHREQYKPPRPGNATCPARRASIPSSGDSMDLAIRVYPRQVLPVCADSLIGARSRHHGMTRSNNGGIIRRIL
jgi:DNA-binding CsgD family transcriptional regulator